MDRRAGLLDVLSGHAPTTEEEAAHLETMLEAAEAWRAPFSRDHLPGHFVASALVASTGLDRVVLLHHRKLDLWLQCGGHTDPGDGSPRQTALREAGEETGLAVAPHRAHPALLDVDVHEIPATTSMPAHLHLDLRYLVEADPGQGFDAPEEEVKEIGWFTWDQLDRLGLDGGLARLIGKARELAGQP